jgi:hypothetical protein
MVFISTVYVTSWNMNYEKGRGEIDVCLQVDELIATNKIEYRIGIHYN